MTVEPGQMDLFVGYPNHPGWQKTDTSRDAAEAAALRCVEIRDKVLTLLKAHALTTAQIAKRLRLRYETVQPRTSELRAMGLIRDTGRRGPSRDPNRTAIVWEAARPG